MDQSGKSPQDYVTVCSKGGKTTIEPYAFHEARVQRGDVPDTFDPQLSYEKVLDAAIDRLRSYSEVHADILFKSKTDPLQNTKFIDNIDIVADESETIPPPLEPGCQVKKLYSYKPPQLSYDFVFNATLWNALSNAGKASVLTNIIFHSCSAKVLDKYEWSQKREICVAFWNDSEIRKITALLYSSKMKSLSAHDWFSELSSVRNDWVVYHGLALKVSGAEFYEETGSLRSASAYEEHRSSILSESVYLKNSVRFHPNGAVHWLTASDAGYSSSSSAHPGIRVNGGEVWLNPDCEAEFSEDQKLADGCVSLAELRSDRYDLAISAHTKFHPSGYLQSAHGLGLVVLSGRIVEVDSGEHRELHFDSDGRIMDGFLARPVKIWTQNAEFELAPQYFEAYPQGGFKSATLASETNARDCSGVIRHFSAGSEIRFNEAGIPCGSIKP
ncbi:MAG: hypothetical protein ACJ763_11650 [Bdellovibrionia bacterium]